MARLARAVLMLYVLGNPLLVAAQDTAVAPVANEAANQNANQDANTRQIEEITVVAKGL